MPKISSLYAAIGKSSSRYEPNASFGCVLSSTSQTSDSVVEYCDDCNQLIGVAVSIAFGDSRPKNWKAVCSCPSARRAPKLRRRCHARTLPVNVVGPGRPLDASERGLKVCGPNSIQTLRGNLLGRNLALVLCGESHLEAMDLTRERGIVLPKHAWYPHDDSMHLNVGHVIATHEKITLKRAKAWGATLLEADANCSEQILTDSVLAMIFEWDGDGKEPKGRAELYCPGKQSRRLCQDVSHRWSPPECSTCFVWSDLDAEARSFANRRKIGVEISQHEHDETVARRKLALRAQGIELLDDWLIRHATRYGDPDKGAECHVDVLLEAPLKACEVELHEERNVQPTPKTHKCIQSIENDSDSDSGNPDTHENLGSVSADPHKHKFYWIVNSSACFLDYLSRRLSKELPHDKFWPIDPRELGDPDDEEMWTQFQSMVKTPPPGDLELDEFKKLMPSMPVWPSSKSARKRADMPSLPSWEAFFGAASENLYYTPGTKVDYVPFLTRLASGFDEDGPADVLRGFFQDLFFGTVPSAIARLRLDPESRSLMRVRSMIQRLPQNAKHPEITRPRVNARHLIPVPSAPVDRYLKAKGSNPPRTWISGMVHRVEEAGGREVVAAARCWYTNAVETLLQDPKFGDQEGDYFIAFLRECHRKIYDDIDISRPELLLAMDRIPSLRDPTNPKKSHDVTRISIPRFDVAASEVMNFDPTLGAPSSRRQRVMAKIIIDAFLLRMVDLSAILRVIERTLASPGGSHVVVILYAGGDHTRMVGQFFQSQGFTHKGLPKKGLVGKEDWLDTESRALTLPSYLQDFREMFLDM
eukprot:TRINITY_DN6963_c0_g1_i1.p1 TRINITY_DN6963_c0_g1~~TRINITY_DN6963_c0_g1_i1.p1  ORF type:complete len:815 (-),score=109.46 TRINITY_DN6963_c0_g1_i1:232-2676(-)